MRGRTLGLVELWRSSVPMPLVASTAVSSDLLRLVCAGGV
jgi:hypothetical protein